MFLQLVLELSQEAKKFLCVHFEVFSAMSQYTPFLAAMSSSRSDVVTQSVRPFVFTSSFLSFSVLEVSSSPKEFQWCFKAV